MTTITAPTENTTRPAESALTQTPSTTGPARGEQIRRKALLRFALSITILNLVGHLFLGFEQAPLTPIVCILVAYIVNLALESLDAWAHRRPAEFSGGRDNLFYFLLPAHIAALACAMLLYADNLGPYLFATVVAVGSKYSFRVVTRGRLRHYLNPSNFGIALTLLLMPLVGFVPPYQFLNNTDQAVDVLIPLGLLMAGTMLNGKLTKRMPLILGWVGGYVLQAMLRTWLFDDSLLATLGMMTGVAFVLFTNYMITDPGTSPMPAHRQVGFGLLVAFVYGTLVVIGISYAIFFALTLVCAGRGLCLFVGERTRRANSPTSTTEQHAQSAANSC